MELHENKVSQMVLGECVAGVTKPHSIDGIPRRVADECCQLFFVFCLVSGCQARAPCVSPRLAFATREMNHSPSPSALTYVKTRKHDRASLVSLSCVSFSLALDLVLHLSSPRSLSLSLSCGNTCEHICFFVLIGEQGVNAKQLERERCPLTTSTNITR